MSGVPRDVAFAAGFQRDDAPAELDKVLPDEKHAGVSLQRHGGDVQQAVALPLQQLVQLLFQEDLRGATSVISDFFGSILPRCSVFGPGLVSPC